MEELFISGKKAFYTKKKLDFYKSTNIFKGNTEVRCPLLVFPYKILLENKINENLAKGNAASDENTRDIPYNIGRKLKKIDVCMSTNEKITKEKRGNAGHKR